MKCQECGGKIIKAPTYTTAERTYEYVCSKCGLVYSEPFGRETEEYMEFKIKERLQEIKLTPLIPLPTILKHLRCQVCGKTLLYKGKGRKPKYCRKCAKLVKHIQTLTCKERLRRKNKLSKNDIYLLAIQKRAS